MKIPNFFKRTAALVLAAVSAFAMVPSGAVYAAEPGKIGSVTARVAKDSDGNPILYNGDATFEGRHVGGKGKEKYRLLVDGYSTFCIEPGASLHNGSELKQSSSAVWDALSADKKQAIGLTLLYGSQGNRDILPGSKDEGWLGTQIIIWEYIPATCFSGRITRTRAWKRRITTLPICWRVTTPFRPSCRRRKIRWSRS